VVNIRGGLGISRHKCFLASAGANTTDIDCVHNPPAIGTGFDLSYADAAHGYDGNQNTIEGTKIIPDGLLTPGASVQYFFRKEDTDNGPGPVGLMPDTNIVFRQNQEGSL